MMILIVDNKPEHVRDLCEILNEEGHCAKIVNFIQFLGEDLSGTDFVIMDIMMDGLVGGYRIEDLSYLGLHLAGKILEPRGIPYVFYTHHENDKGFPVLSYTKIFCRGLYYKPDYPPLRMLGVVNQIPKKEEKK